MREQDVPKEKNVELEQFYETVVLIMINAQHLYTPKEEDAGKQQQSVPINQVQIIIQLRDLYD